MLFSIAAGDDLTLFEVQEAAKVITESIDPNAKVIFGTIHTDKLKKGEIQITVIASGFSENQNKKSLFQSISSKQDDAKVGKIFNSIETKEEKPIAKSEPLVEPKKTVKIEDEEDDWGVPSFLKRSKIK